MSTSTTTPAITIEKYLRGEAYARNGNTHRPTLYVGWRVLLDGRDYGLFRLRRDAVAAVPALVAEWLERRSAQA